MLTAYICRHGETEFNLQKRLQGWIDTPLTETGEQNALQVAEKILRHNITIDDIYSSDLGRAFTTAYLISRHIGYKGDIKRNKLLREVSFGNEAAKPYAEWLGLEKDPDFVIPGGESVNQMQIRVLQFMAQLSLDNTLIAAHDGTINALYANYKGIEVGEYNFNTHNPHDSLFKFTVEHERISSFEEIT